MSRLRRHSDGAWTRFVLALFVTVWLNMALQPCLMAAEPVMPTGHGSGDCVHCPDSEGLMDSHDCSYIDGYDFDGRVPGVDFGHKAAIVLTAVIWDAQQFYPSDRASILPVEARGPPARPALNSLYCVFLN